MSCYKEHQFILVDELIIIDSSLSMNQSLLIHHFCKEHQFLLLNYPTCLFDLQFCLWDFQREKFLLSQTNLSGISGEFTQRENSFTPPDTAVCRINLVDNKLATVTTQCVVKIWLLDFSQHGQVSCHCLHTLTTFKPR